MVKVEKKRKVKDLAQNTVLFTISSFGSKLLTFLLLPLYTAVLSTSDYGTADLITTTVTLLLYIFTINIADGVLRYAIDSTNIEERKGVLYFGAQVTGFGSIIVIIALGILRCLNIVVWPVYCYYFVMVQFTMTAVYQLLTNYMRAVDKIKEIAVVGVLSTAITIFCNIVFLLGLKIGLPGFLASTTLGLVGSNIYCILCLKTDLKNFSNSRLEKKQKKAIIIYVVPTIFNSIAWWVNGYLDRYFISIISGTAQNGLYAVATKIPSILSLLPSFFLQAWGLTSIKYVDKNDEDGFFSNTYTYFNTIMVVACGIMIFLNKFIAHILYSDSFYEGWRASSILMLSAIFNTLSSFVSSAYVIEKKTGIYAVSSVIAAIVNAVLNIVLIPKYSYVGAAVATLISFIIMWGIRYVTALNYVNFKIKIGRDIIAYFMLVLQLICERMNGIGYLGQFFIVVGILFLYRKNIVILFNKTIKACRLRKEKG